MTESSDAGASRASNIGTVRLASDFDINDHIDFDGKPCRVISVYTKRAFCHFRTIDILTGYLVRRIVPISTEFAIPDVRRDLYKLTGISFKDDSVTLLHCSGTYSRNDISLPENLNLRTMMVDGFNNDNPVIVGIVTSLGQAAVYAVDVYPTGTVTRFLLDKDFLNQSTPDDTDVVVIKNVGF